MLKNRKCQYARELLQLLQLLQSKPPHLHKHVCRCSTLMVMAYKYKFKYLPHLQIQKENYAIRKDPNPATTNCPNIFTTTNSLYQMSNCPTE